MSKILVTGASGHLGQLVIKHLLETEQVPANNIIAISRKADSLANLAAQGVEVRAADFDNATLLQTAFAGADRVLLISTDSIGNRFTQHNNAINAAKSAGVQHIVYTSMIDPETSMVSFAPEHADTERALLNSGMSATILRNAWYFENVFFSSPQWLATGQAHTAAGNGKLAHIAREDLARAAAKALASNDTHNATYSLTGSEAFTAREIVDLVAQSANKAIEIVDISVEDVVQGAVAAGLPQPVAEMFASFDANIAAGGFAQITDDFARLTGRQPMKFTDWIAVNKTAFAG